MVDTLHEVILEKWLSFGLTCFEKCLGTTNIRKISSKNPTFITFGRVEILASTVLSSPLFQISTSPSTILGYINKMAIFLEALALGWSADLVPKVSRNSYFEYFSHLLEAVIRPNFAVYVLTSPPTLEWNCGRIEQVDWKKILYVYIYIYNTIQYRCSATSIYWILSSYSNEETCRLSLFTTRPSHRYSLIVTPVLLILLLLTNRRSQWQN